MPRTRRHVRTKKSRSASSGPSIVNLYGRNDASENGPLIDDPSSPISDEKPPVGLASKSLSSQQSAQEDEFSEESDAGWSEDNEMSSELGFSLSLSSSGNANDEEGTITTRGTSANLENNDDDHDCFDDEEEDADIGFKSDILSNGQRSDNSSSSSDDSSSRSRTSSARSESGSESSESSNVRSDVSEESGQDHQDQEVEAQTDGFFSTAFSDDHDLIPKVRMFSTVDDFMERESRREAARRFSLNDRAVFRLIDSASTGNVDCSASDPGWGHIKDEIIRADRRHSLCPQNFDKSFVEDDFEALEWQEENSGGENKPRGDQEVPRLVSTDESDNRDIDHSYDEDDDGSRDHTRNYDSRYDRDLSELVSLQTDRSSCGEEYDSDEDSEDNKYMNRSVASYISADNSSRSQPDPFLKPDVGLRPPTPPSPVKKSPPKSEASNEFDDDVDEIEDHFHSLPESPNLEDDQDDFSTSSGQQNSFNEDQFHQDDRINSGASSAEFHDGFDSEQTHGQNEGFITDDFFSESLPRIDENNPVHYDYRGNGSDLDQHQKIEIPYGDHQSADMLLRKQQRDRKLIFLLAAGLGCALLALAAVLGGVIAAAIVRKEAIQIVETSQRASFPSIVPTRAPIQSFQSIPTERPSSPPTRQPSTLAPQSSPPTPLPSKSPITDPPSKSPVRQTEKPTFAVTLAPTRRTTFGFGGPPSPTPPPTEFSGFGVAKIP